MMMIEFFILMALPIGAMLGVFEFGKALARAFGDIRRVSDGEF